MLYIPILVMAVYFLIGWKALKGKTDLVKYIRILLILYLIISLDLGINYASNSGLNDGIAINGILSKVLILEDNWSKQLFEEFYIQSMHITIFLFLLYCTFQFVKCFTSKE